MGSTDTSAVLCDLLEQIRLAHEHHRPEAVPPLVSEFITAAARRLELLAHKVIRRHAPDRAGETKLLFDSAYERLVASLQKHLPPATPTDYFNIAAAHLRHELFDLCRDDARRDARAPAPIPAGVAADSPMPEEKVGRAEFWQRFSCEVENLCPELREVFDLRWTHGLTHAAAAERLGLNTKRAKVLWEEIKLTLRRRLGDLP